MNNIKVIGLGALNMDYLYRVERILTDGETTVKESSVTPGGSAANTIYGLAKLGVKTGFIGAVGDDTNGKALVRDFRPVRVDTSRIKIIPEARSGAVLGLSDTLGRRSLYVSSGANKMLTLNRLDIEYINQANMLHLTSFADEVQFRMSLDLMERLKPSVKLSFSPGALYTAKRLKVLKPILRKTYILFLNYPEIRQMTSKNMVAGTETCLRLGCRIVVVTMGKGRRLELSTGTIDNAVCYIRDSQNEYAVEASEKPVSGVEATGAGDAFAAGFLYGLLSGRGMMECGRLGDAVARSVIGKMGTRAGYPTPRELRKSYREI